MNKRLVFISNMAAPYQVKFCYALQEFYDTEFWFHVHIQPNRPDWWRIDLGDKCKVLDRVILKRSRRYLSLEIVRELNRFDPDIVVLGGFALPSCIASYHWARLHRKRVVMFTEVSRNRRGVVREKGAFTKLVGFLYRNIDTIMTATAEGAAQFRDVFGFGDRVVSSQYAADIDEHLKHPLRENKSPFVYLFANRLTELYGPDIAIDAFDVVRRRYPGSEMLMNASGELFEQCHARIQELGMRDEVKFLDRIESWNDLHKVYRDSDILLLPARFSAGNFTVLESMASGMGVIVSDKVLGTGARYVKNGRNGFVCDASVDSFVEAISAYNENPVLLRQHGQISKDLVRDRSIASTALLWHRLLEEAGQ